MAVDSSSRVAQSWQPGGWISMEPRTAPSEVAVAVATVAGGLRSHRKWLTSRAFDTRRHATYTSRTTSGPESAVTRSSQRSHIAVIGLVLAVGIVAVPSAGATGAVSTQALVDTLPVATVANPGYLEQLACASVGNCAGIGSYATGDQSGGAFVASEIDGHWGPEQAILGAPLANVGDQLNAVQCTGNRSCVAVGTEYEGAFPIAIVVVERNGVWLPARVLPSISDLPHLDATTADAVSCWGATCTIFGSYTNPGGSQNLYSAELAGNAFGSASTLLSSWSASLGGPGSVQLSQEVCPTAGTCVVAGGVLSSEGVGAAFIATNVFGRWGNARVVPGTISAAGGLGGVTVDALACSSASRCVVGGSAGSDTSNLVQAWIASSTSGSITTAEFPPGLAGLEAAAGGGPNEAADVTTAACVANVCVAGGSYTDAQGDVLPFVDRAAGSMFRAVQTFPGMIDFLESAESSPVSGVIDDISCAATGACVVVGEADGTSSSAAEVSAGLYTAEVSPSSIGAPTSVAGSLAGPSTGALSFVARSASSQGPTSLLLTDGSTYEAATVRPSGISTPVPISVSGSFSFGDDSEGDLISCWSPGNCVAIGLASTITDAYGDATTIAYSAREANGSWRPEEAIPGTEGSFDSSLSLTQLSCSSAATCVIAGEGQFGNSGLSVFVLPMTGGKWGSVHELTGLDTYAGSQANGDLSDASAVDCSTSTSCTLAGMFLDPANEEQPFVVVGRPGSLSHAAPLGLPDTASTDFTISTLSCPASSACWLAGEEYDKSAKAWVPAVTSRTSKGWSAPVEIPGAKGAVAAASSTGYAAGQLPFLSCQSASACEAVVLVSSSAQTHVFTSSLKGSKWSTIAPVPDWSKTATAFSQGYNLIGLACASPGNCVLAASGAVSFGLDVPTDLAFASTETSGVWSATSVLSADPAAKGATLFEAQQVGCSASGACDVFGTYDMVYDRASIGEEEWQWAPEDVAVLQWDGSSWSSPVDLTAQVPGDVRPSEVSCTAGQCTMVATRWSVAGGEQSVVSTVGG